MPGYTGASSAEGRQVLTLKTAVSERQSLAERAKQALGARAAAASQTPQPSAQPQRSYFLPKRHTGYTTYGDASQAYVRSAADVPARKTERGVKGEAEAVVTMPKFEGTTTNRASTQGYVDEEDADFYTRVRKVERLDDDARHSLEDPKTRSGAAKNLRCTAIQVKREHDTSMAPAPMKFRPVPRVRPNATVSAHGTQPARSHSAAPGTGGAAPAPAGRAAFLAGGSTQSLDYPDPRAVAQKADGVLTEKRGATLLASDRALVEGATSRDLFSGTSKALESVASGYMGHVPANGANVGRLRGAGDPLRAHVKTVDTVTNPASNSTTSLLRLKLRDAQVAAETERGEPVTPRTSAEFYASQAAASQVERRINRIECGRKNAVRGFFSRGEGEQDDLVADQFCLRYRPLEGVMRHGPPHQQGWISDDELRRAPRL